MVACSNAALALARAADHVRARLRGRATAKKIVLFDHKVATFLASSADLVVCQRVPTAENERRNDVAVLARADVAVVNLGQLRGLQRLL